MNGACVDFLNSVVGVEAIQSSDPAATMSAMEKKFDVIVLWHSLEHLPDPWFVLQSAAKRLAPGGILLIAIPNIESYDFSVLRAAWVHLDAPRHLFFYTARSLQKLCSGYAINKIPRGKPFSCALQDKPGVWQMLQAMPQHYDIEFLLHGAHCRRWVRRLDRLDSYY